MRQDALGGIGSGLAWAGGTTFLAVPDRGPNATAYPAGGLVDNTTSFIARFETLDLSLSPATSGALPLTLTPTLKATTLLASGTPLVYGATPGLPSAVPPANRNGVYYFTGRSDNFNTGPLSTDADFARLDPEAIRVSADGRTVFVADEYGPYVYQFDRGTGLRIRSYQLPDHFAIKTLSPLGAVEIASNTSGRVTNKGMEGLAITPDGTMLVGLVQSPLLQDGGDGGRANRIVTIDIASGATHEYVYDNRIGAKNYNSSEIIALNNHQFLIDTRDGKGLGDGSTAVIKQLWAVDIQGAVDVSQLSTEAILLTRAVPKQLFMDMVAILNANGVPSTQIPAKIEGLAFGQDITLGGKATHTLFVGNDNDFVPDTAGPNRWHVFGFTDDDLAALGLSFAPQDIVERGPDLSVSMTASTATVVTGATVTYTVGVTNNGYVPADAVALVDHLPAQLSLVSCASSAGSCAGTTCCPSTSFATLGGQASGTLTVSARLDCGVADGAPIVNHAVATFGESDPTPIDDTAATTITAVNPAPTIAGLGTDTPVLWPPNNKMAAVHVQYDIADNCPGTACALEVSNNEDDSPADATVVDGHRLLLRAKRLGTGAGRVYTITVRCTDSGGTVSSEATTVTVPHNQ